MYIPGTRYGGAPSHYVCGEALLPAVFSTISIGMYFYMVVIFSKIKIPTWFRLSKYNDLIENILLHVPIVSFFYFIALVLISNNSCS